MQIDRLEPGSNPQRCNEVVEYTPFVQLLAAAGIPLEEPRVRQLARDAGVRAADGGLVTAAKIEEWIQQCLPLGHIELVAGGVQCTTAHAFPAFRQALLGGCLREWRRPLLGLLEVNAQRRFQYSLPFTRLVALTRVFLCAELHEQQRRELQRLYRAADPGRVYLAAFGSPFDAEVVARIPASERDAVVEGILVELLHAPHPSARDAIAWAQRRSNETGVSAQFKYRTCEQLLWQGYTGAEFNALLLGRADAGAMAVRAAAAAFAGNTLDATRQYELAERLFRDEERSRVVKHGGPNLQPNSAQSGTRQVATQKYAALKLPLGAPMAFVRVAVLLAAKTATTLREAQRLCLEEVRTLPGPSAPSPWRALAQALDALTARRGGTLALSIGPADGFASLMSLAAFSWAQARPLDESHRRTLENWAQAYAAAGYHRAALELHAGLAIAGDRVLDDAQQGTFTALFAQEQPWQRALSALAAIVTPTTPVPREMNGKPKRIVWMIQTDAPGGTPVISVREQTQAQGGRGWSRGRALFAEDLERADLPEQDAKVLAALPREARYLLTMSHGVFSSTETHHILPALVSHPWVVFADAPYTAVELSKATPKLIVERRPEGMVCLRLPSDAERREFTARDAVEYDIPTYGAATERCVLIRDGATRASVLQLTRAHKRVIDLIGTGLEIPGEGIEAVRNVVAGIAGLFEVHSHIATALPETAGDATIHAQLSSSDIGLRLRLTVQPFAGGGPRYSPGAGGERVISEVNGARCAVVRDLSAERRGLASVLERLPVLREHNNDAAEWSLEDPALCLEVVSELQSLGPMVCVEWPAGKKVKVTRKYRSQDFRLSIGGGAGGDWFAVTGRLELDDGTVLPLQRLLELTRANGGRYVPLGDEGLLALSVGLRRRLDELAASGAAQADGSLRVSAFAAGALAETVEDTACDADPEWHARLARLREAQTLTFELPMSLRADLRPYQIEGFAWLSRLAHSGAGACLADDMGLGKTVQAIAMLLHRAAGGPALVVAPTSVCPNWTLELARFAPTLHIGAFGATERAGLVASAAAFDVVVCSYALLLQEIELLSSRRWHTVVLDEAQAVKNFSSKRAQAALKLSAEFRVATTGTPVENRLDELWMLFRFLNPGLLGSREYFNERFAAPIERRQDEAARVSLKRLVAPFLLRRSKSEVLSELPPRTEVVHVVEPSERERAFHEALRRSALELIASGRLSPEQRRFQVLVELTRMRRACCDPRLVADDTGIDGPSGAKLDAFAELAVELAAGGHKALVFSQFVDFLHMLRAKLDALGFSYQYLDGSTAAADRAKAVRTFQSGEGDFFLLSLKAGAVGLNLTAADYVIIADPWWNPAVEDQAAGRAHRMGQERPVTVYRLVIKDSVEERIMSLHRDKRALAEGLFTGEEFGKVLSVEELTALLRGS
jgi:superfamily II DNA or RNA helicase